MVRCVWFRTDTVISLVFPSNSRPSWMILGQCGVGIAFGVDDPTCGALVVKGFVPTGPAAADGTIAKGDILFEVIYDFNAVFCTASSRKQTEKETYARWTA